MSKYIKEREKVTIALNFFALRQHNFGTNEAKRFKRIVSYSMEGGIATIGRCGTIKIVILNLAFIFFSSREMWCRNDSERPKAHQEAGIPTCWKLMTSAA